MASNRVSFLLKTLHHKCSCIQKVITPSYHFQTTRSRHYYGRHMRRPLFLGPSKSKMWYVPEKKEPNLEEDEFMEGRFENYRAAMRGIRHFLRKEFNEREVITFDKQEEQDAQDLIWMADEVNKWNAEIANKRMQRQLAEQKKEEDRIQSLMEKQTEERLQKAMEAEQLLMKEKEASVNFITTENLDMEIEKMLDSRSDYNFAVTLEGEVLAGENPHLEPKWQPTPNPKRERAS